MSGEGMRQTAYPDGEVDPEPIALAQAQEQPTGVVQEGRGRTTTAQDAERQEDGREERGQPNIVQEEEQRAKAAEEEERRAKAAEEERRAKVAREEKRQAKAAEEEKRRANAAAQAAAQAAAKEQERRSIELARQKEIERLRLEWSEGEWTHSRAIHRYMHLFEHFKTCTFSPDSPIEFDLIPWPVIWQPTFLRFQTPTWQAVEEFFKAIRKSSPSRAYKGSLTQAKLHFHPDRLTGRRILSALDEREHSRAHEAFRNVTQAVGSLISELGEA